MLPCMVEVMPERGLGITVLCSGAGMARIPRTGVDVRLARQIWLAGPHQCRAVPDSRLSRPAPALGPAEWILRALRGYISVTSDNQSLTVVPHRAGTGLLCLFQPGAALERMVLEPERHRHAGGRSLMSRAACLRSCAPPDYGPGTQPWQGKGRRRCVISDAWQRRALTQWVPADTWASSFQWETDTVSKRSLLVTNGLLIFGHVFLPTNDSLAYPLITGRNDDGAIKIVSNNGEEWLR